MLTEYGDTIKINRKDILYRQLMIIPISTGSRSLVEYEMVNTSLPINVNKKLAARIGRYGPQIGYHLHKYHKDILMRHIASCKYAGVKVTHAIRSFYDRYDIGDDDFDSANMYREWNRHKEKYTNTASSLHYTVLKNMHQLDHASSRLPFEIIDEILDRLLIEMIDDFFGTVRFDIGLMTCARTYMLSRYSGKSQADIAALLACDQSSVSRRTMMFADYLDIFPDFRQKFNQALDQAGSTVLAAA